MNKIWAWLDRTTERRSRSLAQRTSRRSLLVGVGKAMLAGAITLPVLPFDRTSQAHAAGAAAAATKGPAKDTDWFGPCHNPADGKDYLLSYSDCCGVTSCGRCFCNTNHGDRPGYHMGIHNDINWCMANDSSVYHCTVSVIVGITDKG